MAGDTTPQTLPELVDAANRLPELRVEIVRQINEIFAAVAEAVDEAKEGGRGGIVAFAARMQDERDQARARIAELEVELGTVKTSLDDVLTRLNDAAGTDSGRFLALASAAARLREKLDNIVNRPVSHTLEAKIQGDVNAALAEFNMEVDL